MRKQNLTPTGRSDGSYSSLGARDAWTLALLVGAFLITRAAWLYWNSASVGYWEESYRWVVAHELMTAPSQPFLDYQADHYQGGSLVMSLLAIPFFAIFGESMIALKLSAVTVSTGILATLYLLGRCFFGRSVGLIVALAYLAGPPLVGFSGLAVMGSHGETVLFSLLMFSLFLGLLSGRLRGARSWAALGFVSGFGIWFCYTTGLSLLACGLTWLLLRRPPGAKQIGWATAGVLVGLVPWFIYNVRYGFVGMVRVLEIFGLGDPIDPWQAQSVSAKLVQLIVQDLPTGLMAPLSTDLSTSTTVALTLAFGIPLIVALALSLVRAAMVLRKRAFRNRPGACLESTEEGELELVFVIYGLVFLMFFLLSSFTVDPDLGVVVYRLFTPPAVLLMFPAAISFARLLHRGGWLRVVAMATCGFVLTASAVGTTALAARVSEEEQVLSLFRGYVVMGLLLHRKFENDLPRALTMVGRIPEAAFRGQAWHGIGWGMEYRFEKEGTLETMREALASMPIEARPGVVRGIAWGAKTRREDIREKPHSEDPPGRYRHLLERLDALSVFAAEEKRRLEGPTPAP